MAALKVSVRTCVFIMHAEDVGSNSVPVQDNEMNASSIKNLSRQGLHSLPEELLTEDHRNITTALNLSENHFTTLPPTIATLTQLTHLDLSANRLQEVPLELCQLSALRSLTLKRNAIKSLPRDFGRLRALLELDLSGNGFEVFPEPVCELESLVSLRIGGNFLKTIPASIAKLSRYIKIVINSLFGLIQLIGGESI